METVWNLKLRRFNIKVNQDNHSWFRSNLNDKKMQELEGIPKV